jgi:3-isopropylmalate/(R)-2-methylmalate dehydratase large subunit
MGRTLIEKILSTHTNEPVAPGRTVDVAIDVRAARDFGGANVVRHLERHGLDIDDPSRTLFTFDCNPGGSDQGYAANQHLCRGFARRHGMRLRDITEGIGTHLALEEGLVGPGATFVSTDSHANIMGAIGAFGQGMGDQDIAAAWARGSVWFKVPATLRLVLRGEPSPLATPKDIVLAMARRLGAGGLLGHAAEVSGPAAERLDLAGRITLASMATEMGGIIALLVPDERVLAACGKASGRDWPSLVPDPEAEYAGTVEIDVQGLGPLVARPGHPEDVVPIGEAAGRPVDSVFIGSCTNGRLEDLRAAARVLGDRRVAPGVVLKIVPATRRVWRQALAEGLLERFTAAGGLVGNPGCAGCAAGQIGQNGPGEVTVSTGNRNFAGKQGKGEVYLASPETAAASAAAGVIAAADSLAGPRKMYAMGARRAEESGPATAGTIPTAGGAAGERGAGSAMPAGRSEDGRDARPSILRGRVWIIDRDNIDTDMIYHNAHLAITDPAQTGCHAFGNLAGWQDFAQRARPGDIVATGANFGCGSSRQQAVDCFQALGIAALVAPSFGAIYERNAVNAGMPVLLADLRDRGLSEGDEITIDLASGRISWSGGEVQGEPFSSVQMTIYRRGGLLQADLPTA